MIRLPQVKERVALGTSRIYAMMKDGTFPRPHKFGRASAWREDEIQAWVEANWRKPDNNQDKKPIN
ncbi:AlpA family phage regulatory protein [Candidatus Thiothrix sp. Deng01]|uniref:AlpA family phage regulatory protein n=1 Tax=Candidatus Thiothrix phosphatis TaxID=3112415 RepID=A0ABU6CWH5_9GAMM|nr:AlpA family phage regulatory protein [Candidatus Thiothrix sp. Deng01]